jgi:RNA polymerase sigma-70 factor (ECF subfamily)
MSPPGSLAEASDEQLVLLSKDGDIAAFNSLVERYQRHVFNLCYRLLGHREAAEDATQETFLSAYRAIASLAGGSVRSWLLRIAANQSKDELRRRGRKDQAGSLDQIFDSFDAPVEIPDGARPPEEIAMNHEVARALQLALLELPFEQREAILLADVQGFHYEEIASMTGASEGTVKSRIHRGRARLREIISPRGELLLASERPEEQTR